MGFWLAGSDDKGAYFEEDVGGWGAVGWVG